MIHDAENRHAYCTGKYTADLIYRYPYPNNLGIEIDPNDGRKIKTIQNGGFADKAGLKAGDEVMTVNGQIITSIAAFQWVLHNLPNTSVTVNITARRGGESSAYKVTARTGWKETDFSWRGSLWAMPPKMGIYFPKANSAELRKVGLPANSNAAKVKWINNNVPTARAAKKAGLRLNDIIIAIDGKPLPGGHREINYYIKTNRRPGQKLGMTVLRNGKRTNITIPLYE